jgi:hypothetical protein
VCGALVFNKWQKTKPKTVGWSECFVAPAATHPAPKFDFENFGATCPTLWGRADT